MAEESEKRFHEIMDKLFQTPPKSKSNPSQIAPPSTSGGQLSRGTKRPNTETALAVKEPNSSVSGGTVKAPVCRPWDRGDLLKRLATFKSMTWFAKPQVVSAVNCARRGWINVDSDIIACEACGARLLFSTPSSWTQNQVEKAALVFSLKLDNGHKLLCPWVDNACDEKLAQFPPMPSTDLVDNYQKRVSLLLQLSALPVISSSAIEYMRNPQLEHFLNEFSIVEFGNSNSTDSSTTEYLGNEPEAVSSALYYQALKIISLCGWETRLLPYVVSYKDQDHLSTPPNSVHNGHSPSIISIYPSTTDENVEANENPVTTGVKYDPSSVVLDCKLCGASIGLWAFSTALPPVEFIRLIGSSEINGKNDTPHDSGNASHVESSEICSTSLNVTPSNLKMTIAGGPPPAKQNFRPTISVPVIGRNLRARVSSDSEFRDHQLNNTEIVALGSDKHDVLSKDAASVGEVDSVVGDPCSSQVGNSPITKVGDSVPSESGDASLNDSLIDEAVNGTQNQGTDAICRKDENSQDGQEVTAKVPPVNNGLVPYYTGKDVKQQKSGTAMEFDPIKQHRHFCPWIASSGNSSPGWQQTLSALLRHKDFSYSSPPDAPSTSLIKVDDPVASVKKLFMSPSAKRKKITRGS